MIMVPYQQMVMVYYDGNPMQEGEYNDNGKFEGLYFINPEVPVFTNP